MMPSDLWSGGMCLLLSANILYQVNFSVATPIPPLPERRQEMFCGSCAVTTTAGLDEL